MRPRTGRPARPPTPDDDASRRDPPETGSLHEEAGRLRRSVEVDAVARDRVEEEADRRGDGQPEPSRRAGPPRRGPSRPPPTRAGASSTPSCIARDARRGRRPRAVRARSASRPRGPPRRERTPRRRAESSRGGRGSRGNGLRSRAETRKAMFAPKGHSALDRATRGRSPKRVIPANCSRRSESHAGRAGAVLEGGDARAADTSDRRVGGERRRDLRAPVPPGGGVVVDEGDDARTSARDAAVPGPGQARLGLVDVRDPRQALLVPRDQSLHGGSDAESTTTTSGRSCSAASASRHRWRSSGLSWVHTTHAQRRRRLGRAVTHRAPRETVRRGAPRRRAS